MMWVCVKDLAKNYISLLKMGIALCTTIHEVRKDRHVSREYLDIPPTTGNMFRVK